MSERAYRLVLGFSLLLLLYFKQDTLLYIFIGLLFFEGITNWRTPRLITMLISGKAAAAIPNTNSKFNFEAERVFRMVMGTMLIITYILIPNEAWFFPWFLGAMIGLAGAIGLCPMMIALKWIGFK